MALGSYYSIGQTMFLNEAYASSSSLKYQADKATTGLLLDSGYIQVIQEFLQAPFLARPNLLAVVAYKFFLNKPSFDKN